MPMHHRFLPREGFKFDTLVKIIRTTALNPFVVAVPLLLSRFTTEGQNFSILHPTATSRTKILFYIGLARWISGWLSKRAVNNGTVDKYDWKGKEIVIVTGGSSGIGAKIVEFLSELGIKVVILDIQPPLSQISASNVHFFKCDITSTSEIASVANDIRAKVGQPTVLINNAGVARGKTILDSSERDIRFTFDVNTLGHFWLVKEFLPYMVKQNHGMVVTVASTAAFVTAPNMVDYAGSKAAAMAFHEGLSAELATRYNAPKVRTVLVNQGYTRTALFEGFHEGAPFLVPTLHPETVAQLIVEQVLKGESGHIIAPATSSFLTAFNFMPDWFQYGSRNDMKNLMPKWKGKQVVNDLDKFYEDKIKDKSATDDVGASTVLVNGDEK